MGGSCFGRYSSPDVREKELIVNLHPDIRVVGSLMFAKMSNKVRTDGAPLIIVIFVPFCQRSDVDEDSATNASVVLIV